MTLDNPSIDYFPDLSDVAHPALQGVFRLNLLHVKKNDGQARVGIILPTKSTFIIGGPFGKGPGVHGESFQKPHSKGKLWPTCDRHLIARGHQDGREIDKIVYRDLTWTIECHDWGTVVWEHVPSVVTTSSQFESSAQRVSSASAGQVVFRIPDYDGIRRTGFSTWSVATSIESGREIPSSKTGAVSTLFDGEADPTVSFHNAGNQIVMGAYPSNFNLERRLFLEDRAPTWHIAMNGGVDDFTAEMQRSDYGWWDTTLKFIGPLILGAIVAGAGSWVWHRLRTPNEA